MSSANLGLSVKMGASCLVKSSELLDEFVVLVGSVDRVDILLGRHLGSQRH